MYDRISFPLIDINQINEQTNSHIAGLLEAISDIGILLVTVGPLLRRYVHQNHQPTRLVVAVGQPDGTVAADARQELHVLVPDAAVDAVEGREGRAGDEEAVGRIADSLAWQADVCING